MLLLIAASSPATAEDLASLVDRVIESYGGGTAPGRADIVRQTGHIVAAARGRAGAIERVLQRPNRLRVSLRFDDGTREDRVLDGDLAWKNGVPASPMLRDAMALQAARLSLPGILLDSMRRLVDRGLRTIDGKPLRLIELPLTDTTALLVAVDPKSARILVSTGSLSMGGARMAFTTRYGDFRRWHGVLVAAREEQFAMGRHAGITVLDGVDFPAAVPADTFQP